MQHRCPMPHEVCPHLFYQTAGGPGLQATTPGAGQHYVSPSEQAHADFQAGYKAGYAYGHQNPGNYGLAFLLLPKTVSQAFKNGWLAGVQYGQSLHGHLQVNPASTMA